MGADERRVAGIGDNLIRLSIGLEHADDLIDDLSRALRPGSEAAPLCRYEELARRENERRQDSRT